MKIYHASNATFDQFLDRPTWFSLNWKNALGWYRAGQANHGQQTTFVCAYEGGKIATEKEAAIIAEKVWPDSDLIYSMYDENVGEFDVEEVRSFIDLLQAAGYDASYIEDYDPEDFNASSSRSLCVFHPNVHVRIRK